MTLSIGGLFTLVIVLIAILALVWLAFYVVSQFPPPEPLGRIIRVAIVVFAVLVLIVLLLNFAGLGTGVHVSG